MQGRQIWQICSYKEQFQTKESSWNKSSLHFSGGSFNNMTVQEPELNLEKKGNRSIPKDNFSSRIELSIFLSITPEFLEWSNQGVFQTLDDFNYHIQSSTLSFEKIFLLEMVKNDVKLVVQAKIYKNCVQKTHLCIAGKPQDQSRTIESCY